MLSRGKRGARVQALSRWYKPFARQEEFHLSKAKYRLFGGAAGPGKTTALLWEAIGHALEVPGCDTLLLRRTYPELETSLLREFRRSVPRSMYKSYNESKHVITWKNGSTTRFGYCRNENDVYRYQGAEFLFIGIDELTHFTLKQWQFLTSRNRCPIKVHSRGPRKEQRVVPCMAGATNPGNIGHAWVKALWVDKVAPAGLEQASLYDPREYEFIQARLDDNPVYANDAEYRRILEALPKYLRKPFLEGDWNLFAGQYFDIFDYGRHTARPEEIHLEPWWPRWISIDWGFQHPSAVYWHCAVPDYRNSKYETRNSPSGPSNFDFRVSGDESDTQRGTSPSARIVTYREFVQNGLSPRMLAQAIAERSGRERIYEVFLSPDAFARRTSEACVAEQLSDVLVVNGLPRPAPADDDRVGGWQWMYSLLQSNSWLITENCSELIQCLPNLVRNQARDADIRKVDGDDPADAARYGLVSGARFAGMHHKESLQQQSGPHFVHGMPLDEQIQRQISAQDPTSRAIHSQRLQGEAKKFFRPKHIPHRRW
jgi:phage terminase large subunit